MPVNILVDISLCTFFIKPFLSLATRPLALALALAVLFTDCQNLAYVKQQNVALPLARDKTCFIFGIFSFLEPLFLSCVNFIQNKWDVCSGPYCECPNPEDIHGKSWPDTCLEDVIHGT